MWMKWSIFLIFVFQGAAFANAKGPPIEQICENNYLRQLNTCHFVPKASALFNANQRLLHLQVFAEKTRPEEFLAAIKDYPGVKKMAYFGAGEERIPLSVQVLGTDIFFDLSAEFSRGSLQAREMIRLTFAQTRALQRLEKPVLELSYEFQGEFQDWSWVRPENYEASVCRELFADVRDFVGLWGKMPALEAWMERQGIFSQEARAHSFGHLSEHCLQTELLKSESSTDRVRFELKKNPGRFVLGQSVEDVWAFRSVGAKLTVELRESRR